MAAVIWVVNGLVPELCGGPCLFGVSVGTGHGARRRTLARKTFSPPSRSLAVFNIQGDAWSEKGATAGPNSVIHGRRFEVTRYWHAC